jgi:hypothetical protein
LQYLEVPSESKPWHLVELFIIHEFKPSENEAAAAADPSNNPKADMPSIVSEEEKDALRRAFPEWRDKPKHILQSVYARIRTRNCIIPRQAPALVPYQSWHRLEMTMARMDSTDSPRNTMELRFSIIERADDPFTQPVARIDDMERAIEENRRLEEEAKRKEELRKERKEARRREKEAKKREEEQRTLLEGKKEPAEATNTSQTQDSDPNSTTRRRKTKKAVQVRRQTYYNPMEDKPKADAPWIEQEWPALYMLPHFDYSFELSQNVTDGMYWEEEHAQVLSYV